jgi:hypothetical protein
MRAFLGMSNNTWRVFVMYVTMRFFMCVLVHASVIMLKEFTE